MRRLLLTLGCLVIALASAATPVAAQAPTRDSVTGTAGATIPGLIFVNWTVDASSGPLGEDPTGTVQSDVFGAGPVSCLRVESNRAVVGAFSPTFLGGFLIEVVDTSPLPAQDLIAIVPTHAPPPSICPRPGDLSPSQPPYTVISTGNLTVVDAHPFPTTKAQCQNGGWRDFPGFKNHGQCVAFVNHNP